MNLPTHHTLAFVACVIMLLATTTNRAVSAQPQQPQHPPTPPQPPLTGVLPDPSCVSSFASLLQRQGMTLRHMDTLVRAAGTLNVAGAGSKTLHFGVCTGVPCTDNTAHWLQSMRTIQAAQKAQRATPPPLPGQADQRVPAHSAGTCESSSSGVQRARGAINRVTVAPLAADLPMLGYVVTFEDGSLCDATHKRSQTQVALQCDLRDEADLLKLTHGSVAAVAAWASSQPAQGGWGGAYFRVDNVTEGEGTSRCNFKATVTTALACPLPVPVQGNGGSVTAASREPAVLAVRGCRDTWPPRSTSSCPTFGGSQLELIGRGFSGLQLQEVLVGTAACKDASVMSDYVIVCTLPPGFGKDLNVTVKATQWNAPRPASAARPTTREAALVLSAAVSYRLQFDPFMFDPVEELGVGGLDRQIKELFRRVFSSRAVPPSVLQGLGVGHVKGVMLYGPPGTGKTLLARQLAKFLTAADVQLVRGPEVMSKYVGESEQNIRRLFAPAEAAWEKHGANSKLHVIIIDEMDAMCRERNSGEATPAQQVYDGVVNQLLAKMDGLTVMDNVLVVGMTNRWEVLDTALLRPGRFEVQIRIDYPDRQGREEIFHIHTREMAAAGFLHPGVSLPYLANATSSFSGADIAGVVRDASAHALSRSFASSAERAMAVHTPALFQVNPGDFDRAIAALSVTPRRRSSAFDSVTAPVTGPDVQTVTFQYGVHQVPVLTSALQRAVRASAALWGVDAKLVAGLSSVLSPTREAHGNVVPNPPPGTPTAYSYPPGGTVDAARTVSVLLHGTRATGLTALAADLGAMFGRDRVFVVSPERMLSLPESRQAEALRKVFADARTFGTAAIVLDRVEGLVHAVAAADSVSCSHTLVHTLGALMRQPLAEAGGSSSFGGGGGRGRGGSGGGASGADLGSLDGGSSNADRVNLALTEVGDYRPQWPVSGPRLLVVGTTNSASIVKKLGLQQLFRLDVEVPRLGGRDIIALLHQGGVDCVQAGSDCSLPPDWSMGAKQVLELAHVLREYKRPAPPVDEPSATGGEEAAQQPYVTAPPARVTVTQRELALAAERLAFQFTHAGAGSVSADGLVALDGSLA